MQYYNQPYQPYPPYYPYPPQPDPAMEAQYRAQYEAQMYKKSLRSTVNGLGGLLIIFFGLEVILGTVISLIMYAASGFDIESVLSLLADGLLSCVIFFIAGVVYCLVRKLSFARLFPFERVSGKMMARMCVIGITFSLMSNYVVDLVSGAFGLFGVENSGGTIDAGSEPNAVVYIMTVAILPALVEEFAFRGVIMGSLRPYSEGLAILVSSAAFALMHGNFVQLPFTFCCGLVFAIIDIKTNSLLPSIIAHFLNNGLSVLFDILTSYGIISELVANLCYGIIFSVLAVLTFIIIKRLTKEEGREFFTLKDSNTVLPFKEKIKTAATSPTMIIFAVLMLAYCVLVIAVF